MNFPSWAVRSVTLKKRFTIKEYRINHTCRVISKQYIKEWRRFRVIVFRAEQRFTAAILENWKQLKDTSNIFHHKNCLLFIVSWTENWKRTNHITVSLLVIFYKTKQIQKACQRHNIRVTFNKKTALCKFFIRIFPKGEGTDGNYVYKIPHTYTCAYIYIYIYMCVCVCVCVYVCVLVYGKAYKEKQVALKVIVEEFKKAISRGKGKKSSLADYIRKVVNPN